MTTYVLLSYMWNKDREHGGRENSSVHHTERTCVCACARVCPDKDRRAQNRTLMPVDTLMSQLSVGQ